MIRTSGVPGSARAWRGYDGERTSFAARERQTVTDMLVRDAGRNLLRDRAVV